MINKIVRPRYGGSKVKSGCITCKARHIKCDEKRPSCQRCVKGGRDCTYGVADPAQKRPTGELRMIHYVVKVPMPKSPSSFPNWTSLEKRSLDFFQSRTSIELAGSMISELWSTFILQAAFCYPAVKHAVIALGALHETFQNCTPGESTDFAVKEYGAAIRAVSGLRLDGSDEALNIALLSCVLFAAFESLRGYYKSALTHISSGMKMVTAQEKERGYVKGRSDLRKLIQPVFVCLDTQAMEVCDDLLPSSGLPYLNPDPLVLPKSFRSIEEACNSFTIYRNRVLCFFQRHERLLDPNNVAKEAQDVRTEQVNLARYFRDWCNVFDQAQFPKHHPQSLIIQMYISTIRLIATLVPGPDEIKWDASYAHFERLVELGEDFMFQSANSLPRKGAQLRGNFTFGHGIITPIYLTCTRCRDPFIRRRALRILQTCNRKEGIWDSTQSARVAERIIQIEESTAGGTITNASQIPSHARIESLETSFGPGKRGKIMYTMNGAATPITIVEHLDHGAGDATWEMREEDMKCRSFFATNFTVLPRQVLLS